MNEKREFTGVFIPAHIWESSELIPAEKMLLGEIDSLSKKQGFCDASRAHFAKWLQCTESNISKYFTKLERLGFVSIEHIPGERNRIRLINSRFWVNAPVNPIHPTRESHSPLPVNPIHPTRESHSPEIQDKYNNKNNTVGSNAPTDFDSLWEKYNFKKGSKKKALDLYLKLPEKDRQALHLALPAYLADSVTQQIPGAPFKPLRRHLQFFISGRVWESYLDQIQESKAEDHQTPYDEQYAAYLDYCQKKYPAVLDSIRHLSKKQFVEYKEQNYHPSLHRLGQKMQVNEFLRSHVHFQDGHPETAKHSNVWEYHKVRLGQLIHSALNI